MFDKSIKAFENANLFIPGGVELPVRAFKSVNMNLFFLKVVGVVK